MSFETKSAPAKVHPLAFALEATGQRWRWLNDPPPGLVVLLRDDGAWIELSDIHYFNPQLAAQTATAMAGRARPGRFVLETLRYDKPDGVEWRVNAIDPPSWPSASDR